MAKRNVILLFSMLLVIAVVIIGVTYIKNTAKAGAESARDRSVVAFDELKSDNYAQLSALDDIQCQRMNWYSAKHCDASDTRVYSVARGETTQNQVAEKLRRSGWLSSDNGFMSSQSETSGLGMTRNLNDNTSGVSSQQDIRIVVTDRVPTNNSGYFQGTNFRYNDESLKSKLQTVIDKGDTLMIITIHNYYDTWL